MKTKILVVFLIALGGVPGDGDLLSAQQSDITAVISSGGTSRDRRAGFARLGRRAALDGRVQLDAVGRARRLRRAEDGGQEPVSADVPQRPQDFRAADRAPARAPRPAAAPVSNGPWLTDWSGPPVNANYLAFGYTGVQDGRLVLFGWLYNVGQPDATSAQVIGKLYFGSLDADGAQAGGARFRRRYSAAVRRQEPGGHQDLFRFRPHRQPRKSGRWITTARIRSSLTQYHSTSSMPAVSPDGKTVRVHDLRAGQSADHDSFDRDRAGDCRFTIRCPRWSRRRNSRPTASNCCSRPRSTAGCRFASPISTAAICGGFRTCARSKFRPR